MKEVVLITGANGNLAKQLTTMLEGVFQIKLLSRTPKLSNEYLWDIDKQYIDPNGLKDVDHIIHLSGASIAAKRWSVKRKREIYSSRIDTGKLILSELQKSGQTVQSFVSASAVGYYGSLTLDCVLNEENPSGDDFLSKVCIEWESVAHSFESLGVARRTCVLRFGIILDKNSGALRKMIYPIKHGVGSVLGTGTQWFPWIHIEDLCSMIRHVILNRSSGVFNAVSPTHISHFHFMQALAKQLKRKIIIPNTPAIVFKILLGEMSVILLTGTRVSSDKIKGLDFTFRHTDINKTLINLLDDDI